MKNQVSAQVQESQAGFGSDATSFEASILSGFDPEVTNFEMRILYSSSFGTGTGLNTVMQFTKRP